MNLNDDPRGGTFCKGNAGLAIGDGAKTGPAIVGKDSLGLTYCIDGIDYYKDDAAAVCPLTAAAVQAVSTTCMYLIQIDADGTVTSVKGTEVATGGDDALYIPPAAAGKCPIGAVKIVTDSTHTFTPGTTALDAAGITETYYNLTPVPVNPFTA